MEGKDDLFERLMHGYISGTISEEEKAMLFTMVQQSDSYREQYNRSARLHALLHVPALEAEKEVAYQSFRLRLQKDPEEAGRKHFFYWGRFVAAAVVLMVLSSLFSIYIYKKQTATTDTALCEAVVPLGCQTKILLPDSSVVVLNSGSILKYPANFGKKDRLVYLDGEGYFKVTKDTEKKFQVVSGAVRVKVTGTVFNVRAYPEDEKMEVSLIEGGVDVSGGDKTICLKPDEKAVYNRTSGGLERVACEAYKLSLWTTGKLSFVNTSFPDLLKSIGRKYNVKIRILSTNVKNDVFSGTIKEDMPLQEVFNFIDMDKKYVFENSGSTIVLRDR